MFGFTFTGHQKENLMKKYLLPLLCITFFASTGAFAQLRGNVSTPFDYQGPIINHKTASIQSKLVQLFNSIQMSHSYSMSFGSYGGSYQSMNAYTNTMQMHITDNLDARFDVSFLHSPFGGTNMYGVGQNSPRVILSNAELNYRVNDRTHIQLRFQQSPTPFGYGYGQNYFYDRLSPWY